MCDECAKKYEQEKKEKNRQYDKNVRKNKENKKYDSFYHSREWQRTRDIIIRKYNGLCLYSLIVDKKIVYADVVHHIIEIKSDWDKRLSINNLILLSHEAHNKIHEMYKKDKVRAMSLLYDCLECWKEEYRENE